MNAPGVAEAAVVGLPDAQWGESLVAFIVPMQGATIDGDALDQHCKDNIARFKRPKRYIFIEELPKNNNGKVLKTVLRDRLKQRN